MARDATSSIPSSYVHIYFLAQQYIGVVGVCAVEASARFLSVSRSLCLSLSLSLSVSLSLACSLSRSLSRALSLAAYSYAFTKRLRALPAQKKKQPHRAQYRESRHVMLYWLYTCATCHALLALAAPHGVNPKQRPRLTTLLRHYYIKALLSY